MAPKSSLLSSSSRKNAPSDPPTSVPSPSTTPAPSDDSSVPRIPLPRTFTDNLPLPRVLIFDLDYTLWPFWCDTHCSPPFKALAGTEVGKAVTDRRGDRFGFYSQVPGILAAARAKDVKVAAASRTSAPDVAEKLLSMLTAQEIAPLDPNGRDSHGQAGKTRPAREFFDHKEIYPGNKIKHMEGIKKALGIEFEDMVFWDDEERNRNVERERGVCFWLVRDGVTREEIDNGIYKWRALRGKKV